MEILNIYLIENENSLWGYEAMNEDEYISSDLICDEKYEISVDGKKIIIDDSQKYLGIKSEPFLEFGDKYNSVMNKLDQMEYETPIYS